MEVCHKKRSFVHYPEGVTEEETPAPVVPGPGRAGGRHGLMVTVSLAKWAGSVVGMKTVTLPMPGA